MVDFALSEEERMVQQMTHEFAEKEIRPIAAYYDENEEFPYDLVKKAAGVGLIGGGLSGGGMTPYIITEELSWGCAGCALAIQGTGLAAAAIAGMATGEQRARYMPMIISDEKTVRLGAMALSEPEAGSDVKNLSTTATRDGDDWILNGQKRFITNGGIADLTVVFATEDKSKGWGAFAGFVVEKDTPGLSETTHWKKMGIRASYTADIALDNVRVPADHRLGYRPDGDGAGGGGGGNGGGGALGALMTLERSRPSIGAFSVGIGRAAVEYAVQYAKDRTTMGKPIIHHQGIGFKLADMAIAVDSARLMVWRAGWMANNNVPFLHAEGSMAKCYPSDVAMKVTLDALQIAGGYGYMREFPLEKWVRDAKIFQIFEGTNEIQRLVIARALATAVV